MILEALILLVSMEPSHLLPDHVEHLEYLILHIFHGVLDKSFESPTAGVGDSLTVQGLKSEGS